MQHPRKVFLTFASSSFYDSMRLLMQEVTGSGFFDTYIGLKDTDIPDFVHEHASIIKNNPKGFGCMIWKPYVIKAVLDTLKEGDVLVYCDAGCSYNRFGLHRLRSYIRHATESPSGIVCFRLFNHLNREWTKGDVLRTLDPDGEHADKRQITSCLLVVKKCSASKDMINEWNSTTQAHHMFDDSPSQSPNHDSFRAHRHDQSILSLLCYKHGCKMLEDETWFFKAFSSHGILYPFWALRRCMALTPPSMPLPQQPSVGKPS